VRKNLSEMKKNVKNGKETVKPEPIAVRQSVLPFFISSLINGNNSCLDARDRTLVIPDGYRFPGFKSENSLHDCKYKPLQGSRVASGRKLKTCPVMVRRLRACINMPLAISALKSTYQLRLCSCESLEKKHDGRDKKNSLSMLKKRICCIYSRCRPPQKNALDNQIEKWLSSESYLINLHRFC